MTPGRALAGVGEDATAIGQDIVKREVQLRQAAIAMEKTAEGAREADKLYSQIITDPARPNEFLAQGVEAELDILRKRIGKDIKDPRVRQVFDSNFVSLTTQRITEARALQFSRTVSASRAALVDSLDTFTARAVDATGQELAADVEHIKSSLDAAVAAKHLTTEQAANELRQRMEQIDNAKTMALIRDKPAAALAELSETDPTKQSFSHLSPERRQDFINQARTQDEARRRQALADQEKRDRDGEKAHKNLVDSMVTEMVSRARDGNLDLQDLEDQRRRLNLGVVDYERIRDHIEKRGPGASDANTLRDITVAVRSVNPRVTKAQLADLYLNKRLLGREDYERLDEELTGNLRHMQDERRSDVRYYHSQAEQIVKEGLRSQGPLAAISQSGQQTLAVAMEELTRRSSAFRGTEDPLAVAQDVVRKHLPTVAFASRARLNAMRAGIAVKSYQQLGTREQARARGMSDQDYNEAVRRLMELEATETELTRMEDEINRARSGR